MKKLKIDNQSIEVVITFPPGIDEGKKMDMLIACKKYFAQKYGCISHGRKKQIKNEVIKWQV